MPGMMMYDTVQVNGLGVWAVPKLSEKLRFKAKQVLQFAPFARSKDAFGANEGDVLYFDKVASDLSVTADIDSSGVSTDQLTEGIAIPTDTFSMTQSSIQIAGYGRAINYTGELDKLGKIRVTDIIEKLLRNRIAYTLDLCAAYAMKSHGVFYTPTSATGGTLDTDGTVSTTALSNITTVHVKDILDKMRGDFKLTPYFEQSREFGCIATTTFLRGLKDDPDFIEVAKYAQPKMLLNGEVGTYYGCRFIETNHANALNNAVGSGGVLGEAIFFADDPIIHISVVAPEIRLKQSADYGRDMGMAWYALFKMGAPWYYPTDGEAHTVFVTSA